MKVLNNGKNLFIIKEVRQENNKLHYSYSVKGPWRRYFRNRDSMWIEYCFDKNDLLPELPKSLAVVPLIANIMPLVWIVDATVQVETLDEDFYRCLESVKRAYQEMHPHLSFRGKVSTKTEKNVQKQANGGRTIQLFSGGVDAFFTLFSHLKEKPILFTVWGSDIYLKDENGWANVQSMVHSTAQTYGLETCSAKSSFRRVLSEKKLKPFVQQERHGNWWHTMQHSIVLLAHAAIPAWCLGAGTVYIASSYTIESKGKINCASDPRIDNNIQYCGARVIHDGYEHDRQQKVYGICDFAVRNGKSVPLRVCWQSAGGENCGLCEKCCRTICEILCAGADPNRYGFRFTQDSISTLREQLCEELIISKEDVESWYLPMQAELRKNWDKLPNRDELVWLRDLDFSTINEHPHKKQQAAYERSLRFKLLEKAQAVKAHLTGMYF